MFSNESKLRSLILWGNHFNEASVEKQEMMKNYLKNYNPNVIKTGMKLDLWNCEMTDEVFIPIIDVLKYVEEIDIRNNKLTHKSFDAMEKKIMEWKEDGVILPLKKFAMDNGYDLKRIFSFEGFFRKL